MAFARTVWKILVAVKDGLVLVLLLLFFGALYAVLSSRPNAAAVQDGALLLSIDGPIVEEPAKLDPLDLLASGAAPLREYRARDLVLALDAAARDTRIKAVVLDLDQFTGGGQVSLTEVGEAVGRVRSAGKPVLAHAIAYTDDAMLLAAHASEVWVDPMGGALIAGPGGESLYYKQLLDRLQVNVHVFRVGTFKSAVEPFIRTDQSAEAAEQLSAVYSGLWEDWQARVRAARPKADIARVTSNPVAWLESAGGNLAQAAQSAGLVDRIGDATAFGRRVAEIAGEEPGGRLGTFRHTTLAAMLADQSVDTDGRAIAVVTVAGTIVDGEAGPGTAGGDRIAKLIDEAIADAPAALVVRVDSPGGSVIASERIRTAIDRAKAANIPVAVSMGNMAASGGYWVATPGARIFAEPATITGSIGIFAVIPTFERTLADWGVTTDGVRTTPLSGQPDLAGGLTPEVQQLIQANVESGYSRFLGLVGKSRNMDPAAVDRIAQGRVWDGGTARQIGLVDQFGGLDDALAWAAARAKLGEHDWHPVYLGTNEGVYDSLLMALFGPGGDEDGAARDLAGIAAQGAIGVVGRAISEVEALVSGRRGVQAYCLECPPVRPGPVPRGNGGLLGWLARLAG